LITNAEQKFSKHMQFKQKGKFVLLLSCESRSKKTYSNWDFRPIH